MVTWKRTQVKKWMSSMSIIQTGMYESGIAKIAAIFVAVPGLLFGEQAV